MNPCFSKHLLQVQFLAAVVGAGANPPTIPATSVVPAADNFALSAARTSEGLYVVTLKEVVPRILDVACTIMAASGAFKHVYPVSWSETTPSITVQVMLANGGGVDDIESTDLLRLMVTARLGLA